MKKNSTIIRKFVDNLSFEDFTKIIGTVWKHSDTFDLEFNDETAILNRTAVKRAAKETN